MPASPASPARIRVTDTVAIHHATQVDVMFSGPLCRLNLYTLRGVVRVTLPLDAFVEKCRAPRDANGQPFPAVAHRAAVEQQLEADAAEIAPKAAVLTDAQVGQIIDLARSGATQQQIAAQLAISQGTVSKRLRRVGIKRDAVRVEQSSRMYRGRDLAPGLEERYLAAYLERRRTGEEWMPVAERHGLNRDAWYQWTRRHPAKCEAAWSASRPPVTKPSGKLL